MTPDPGPPTIGGTYILLIEVPVPVVIEVGRLGAISIDAGHWAYVGSAFGPGGLAARLRRYAAGPRRRHWHVDFLLEDATVTGALLDTSTRRLECRWARWWADCAILDIRRFGSSDCRCSSHLFFLGDQTNAEDLIHLAGCELRTEFVDRNELIGDQ